VVLTDLGPPSWRAAPTRVRPTIRPGQTGVLTSRVVPWIAGEDPSTLSPNSGAGGPAGREAVRRRRVTVRGASCAGTLGASLDGGAGGSGAGDAAGPAPSCSAPEWEAPVNAGADETSPAPGSGAITWSDAAEAPDDPRPRDRDRRPLTLPGSLEPDGAGPAGTGWLRALTSSADTSTPRPLQCSQILEYASSNPV